jgi:predicted esterase
MISIFETDERTDLPAILCLHGAGTNGIIFQLQARMIIRKLSSVFRFIFVDAPFESIAGPGVFPTYEGIEPYLWWHCDESASLEFDISLEEVRYRRQIVQDLLVTQLERTEAVGIMAFSQGARVATGLCLDTVLGKQLKFAILMAATFPALQVGDSAGTSLPRGTSALPDSSGPAKPINIPSVHIQGTKDPWRSEGSRIKAAYYEDSTAELVQFTGGHAIPTAPRDVEKAVAAILKAWARVS